MRKILSAMALLLLVGCEATPVKDAGTIRTKQLLNKDLVLPVQVPVAFYVEKYEPEEGINFYGFIEEAADLVGDDMFVSADKLAGDQQFQYLLRLKGLSTWNYAWGNWVFNLETEVVNRQGEVLYTGSARASSSGAGLYDINAVKNSIAKAVKEVMIGFLNNQGSAKLAEAVTSYQSKAVAQIPIKSLLKDMKPTSSGTGFFVNASGDIATAAHVVDECVLLEVVHKAQTVPAKVIHSSALLDLAVLHSDMKSPSHVAINGANEPSLGTQVFVAGFPLAGILADYPSLTMGNVSSMGGLKGSEGQFQFTAPVQPGNSGGPVVDYRGNLVGVVSGTLNQAMMLRESGTAAQNLNFGIEMGLLKAFLDRNGVHYAVAASDVDFEKASAAAVDYTNQVLCYQ